MSIDYSVMKFAKNVKTVHKKKNQVSKETYEVVEKSCKEKCALCGKKPYELHHIAYRSERRDLIDEPTNCIMLCKTCHDKVHGNKKYWQPRLLKLRAKLK